MKILVTGATGFIGGSLMNHSLMQNHELRGVYRSHDEPSHFAIGEITPFTNWDHALHDIDIVIHLAGKAHDLSNGNINKLMNYRDQNVACTLNLARQAAGKNVKRFIYLSSIKAMGDKTVSGQPFDINSPCLPTDPYGISKLEAERGLWQIAKSTSMGVVIIRPPLVYGPNPKGNLDIIVRLIKRQVPLPFSGIKNLRSFIAIDTLIRFIVHCVESPRAHNMTFLVSDGCDLSTSDFLIRYANSLNIKHSFFWLPPWISKWILSIMRKRKFYDSMYGFLQIDISDTIRALDWRPPLAPDLSLEKSNLKR